MMIERPAVTVSTPAGSVSLTVNLEGAVPVVKASFERLVVARVPYAGWLTARVSSGVVELAEDSINRADDRLRDPTWQQQERVRDFLRYTIRQESWRVLEGAVARDTRKAELEREVAVAAAEVARLRERLADAVGRESAARAELAVLTGAA